MGFLLWGLLTAVALAAGAALAIRLGAGLRVGEQLVASCVGATAIVILAIDGLGYSSLLYPSTVAAAVLALSGLLLALTRPARAEWKGLGRRLGGAARTAAWSPVSGLLTAVALGLVLLLAAYVVLLPSWGWDAMWYHDPLSAYAYQEHSLGWVETWIPFINSYPKNVELLALWNALFAPDDRLLDGAQLPLVLVGIVALATTCRRAGASAPLAWGLGLCWLLMPAVYLNTPSNYVDAGATSLWLAAVLFLARLDATRAHRLFGALALGLYAGAKVSGLLHTLLLAPVILLALGLEWRRARNTRALLGQTALATLLIALLGAESYVRDLWRYGNPFWPAQVPIPLLGRDFPGTWKLRDLNTPPFGGPDDWSALWRSWNETQPTWLVDVRVGGFGPLWVNLLLPAAGVALLFALVQLARRRTTPGALAVGVLLFTALATPARWWPRYTLGLPAAGLLAAAILISLLPRAWLQQVALLAIGGWACAQAWPARVGLLAPREKEHPERIVEVLAAAAQLPAPARAAIKLDNWQHDANRIRDAVIQPGDGAAYDGSTSFVYQLWRSDWHSRVLYRPLAREADAADWLAGLERERVVWASFERGSLAERTLRAAGWRQIQQCQSEGCAVWVRAPQAR
jgi:hypothetical protein